MFVTLANYPPCHPLSGGLGMSELRQALKSFQRLLSNNNITYDMYSIVNIYIYINQRVLLSRPFVRWFGGRHDYVCGWVGGLGLFD